MPSPTTTTLKLFTFCFYIDKNSYQELVRMLFVLVASLDQFHPDFFLVVYHNVGLTFDDPRVECRKWEVKDGDGERLLLEAAGCDGNVWVEGSAVRNRWHKLSFNKIHVFKSLYDEYGGECFTWIDLDTIVLADLSYLDAVDNYFVIHGGRSERTHEVLCRGGGGGGGGGVIWAVPERMYIQGSFWKLNLSLYHEILRLDLLFRENGVVLKYDLQSIFAVMAWGGGGEGGGVSRADDGSMLVIGYNYRPDVMNGLGVWDTKDGAGNHVNTSSLADFYWGGPPPIDGFGGAVDIDRRLKLTVDYSRGCSAGVPPPSDGFGDAVDINRRLKLTVDCSRGGPPPIDGIYARLADYTRGSGAALARTSGVAESRDCEAMSDGATERVSTGSRDCEAMSDGATERVSIRTMMYPNKEVHILSLTFDSFFMSNVSGSADFARLFPFLLV
jgi:hypothetical protein